MARCTITMTVDTQNINSGNIDSCVTFSDSYGVNQDGSPVEFTSDIKIGDEVYWVARPKDRSTGDTVSLDSITYEADTNILGETTLHGGADGSVLGVAVHGQEGDEEEYGINFIVTKGTNSPVSYFIDPKLRVQS